MSPERPSRTGPRDGGAPATRPPNAAWIGSARALVRERAAVEWRRLSPLGLSGWLQRAGRRTQLLLLDPAGRRLRADLVPPRMRCATARVLVHEGRLLEAERELRLGLARRPRDPRMLTRLSLALTHAGRLDEAYAAACEAVARDPVAAGAWLQLAFTCAKLGRPEEARAAVRAARADGWKPAGDGAGGGHGAPGHIVMVHTGRCGSTVLADLVSQHREVAWERELYVPSRRLWHGRGNPLQLLHDRLAARTSAASPRYGFEFQVSHAALIGVDLPAYLDLLPAFGVEYAIALRRRNLLRVLVSYEIARRTGRWQRRTPSARRNRIDVPVDTTPHAPGLVERLEELDRRSRSILSALDGRPHLRLEYEADISGGPHVGYAKLCEYARIEPREVPVRVHRSNPSPLRDLIRNYDRVAAALAGTPFAWMLDG